MAYGLKYSQYLEKGGATLQIRVYVDGWSGASYGMAHLTGASLQLIGGQANILAPYIKTSFSFSLADCWDEGTTKADGTTCVNAQNEKCGRWEEFYTPDATKFRVELWAKATPSATAARIWRGYVTPDSWSENMMYRGTVTVTARDMLGALQDKEFDLTGRVSILDIVQGALSACQSPMGLSYTAGHFLVNEDGSSILSHTIAASTFAGDTWQTVLQDTLESLGLTLRYNGHDALVLTSLRYIAADTTSGSHTIEYINRSGLRELDPALKFITETFDVDVVELSNPDPAASQYAATGSNLTQKIVAQLAGGGTQTSTNYIPGYTLTESGGEGWSGTLAVPALGTVVDGAADRSIYFPTDIQETVAATLHLPRMRGYFAFKIEQDGALVELGTRTGIGTVIRPCTSGHSIGEVRVRVSAVVSGTTKYLSADGSWGTTSTDFGVEIGQEVIVPDPGAVGVSIAVVKVITENTMPAYYSILAALKVTVSPGAEGASIISEYKTTTRYDDANNVTITRRPAIGSASLDGCVDFFQNVLALGDAIAADRWNWPGASSYYPLAVMIQAQALCYYSAAASVFTGTAHDKAAELALPGCGYTYYQRSCVPVSATFDFGSGFIVQTNLREYYTWESVWGTFSPDYSEASGSGRGSTSATGASGASINPGSGSGGTGGGGGVNYFQINGTLASLVELKDQYTYLGPKGGLFFSGATLSGTPTPDLYVDTVNNQRVLRSPLPLITGGDQIVIDGTPGGGGGGGSATLAGLDDVSLSGTPTQGQYLAVGSNGKWTNVPAPSGGGSVNSIVVGTTAYNPVDGVVTLPAYTTYTAGTGITISNSNQISVTANTYAPYNSAGYLPLSGGTMTADATISWGNNDRTDWDTIPAGIRVISSIETNSGAPTRYSSAISIGTRYSFQIAAKGGDSMDFYIRNGNNLTWRTLYHDGNLTQAVVTGLIGDSTYAPYNSAGYLPLTGGTISTNSVYPLQINDTRSNSSFISIRYSLANTVLGSLGFSAANTPCFINAAASATYGLWHEGNSNSTSFAWSASSLTLAGAITGATSISASANISGNSLSIGTNTSGWTAAITATQARTLLAHAGGDGLLIDSMTSDSTHYLLGIRCGQSTLGTGGDWAMFVRADGKVGFGTGSPAEVVDVVGNAKVSGSVKIGSATLSWNSDGYLYIDKPLVTEGDQIVNSGTPGGGGSGGGAGFTYELKDTLSGWTSNTGVSNGSVIIYQTGADSKNGTGTGAWKYATLGISNISGLQTALDGKQAAGNYLTSAVTSLGGVTGAITLSGGLSISGSVLSGTTYSLLTSSANGLAPAFSTANKANSASTNSYYFLGWTGSTMKWYTLPANAFSDTTYSAATQSAAGLMSSADKTKLDGIATGATAVTDSTVSGWGYLKTDEKVKQTATTTSAAYEILFSESANNTTATEGARKTSTLTYNPSTKALSTGGAVNGLTLTAATTGFTIAGGSTTSKTLTVNETGTAVLLTATQALTNKTYNGYTLGDACAKGYTDSSSASAISTGTSLVTERDVYYGLPTINNSHTYTSSTTIYAPTGAGTSGYWLKAAGGTSAPTWEATSNLEAGKVTTTADTTNALYVVGVTSGATSTLKRDTSVTITGGAVSATSLTLAGALSGATTGAFSSNVSVGGDLTLSTNAKAIYFTDKPASGTGTARAAMGLDTSNHFWLGYGTATAGYGTYIYGNDIIFGYGTSHTEAMRINSSGNVGIGTASPGQKLSVVGSSGWTSTFVGTSACAYLAHSDGSAIYGASTSSSASYYLLNLKYGQSTLGSGGTDALKVLCDGSSQFGGNVTPTGDFTLGSDTNSWGYGYILRALYFTRGTSAQGASAIGNVISTTGRNSYLRFFVTNDDDTPATQEALRIDQNRSATFYYTLSVNSFIYGVGGRLYLRGGSLTNNVTSSYLYVRDYYNLSNNAAVDRVAIQYTGSGATPTLDIGAGTFGTSRTNVRGKDLYFYTRNGSTTINVLNFTSAGAATFSSTITSAGDQVVSSDATLKTNWRELNYGVADIAKCTAGVFDWKDGHGTSIGTKAQDWKSLLPELVHGDEGNMSFAYGQAALVNTIILARQSESHEERIKRLEARVAELETENERLRAN